MRRQRGGYASVAARARSRAVDQRTGTETGRSQLNGEGRGDPLPSAPQPARASAATRGMSRVPRDLDVAVAIAGPAVVVGVVVAAVVLRNSVRVVLLVLVVGGMGPGDPRRRGQAGGGGE